ncbi:plasmid pRiA4b ORF-3 family protein [Ruminococcus gauvreauii]|uniref:plasmid pRiA4b ORF-3 family protein n=1 Tax=Ruminococcus gauvreauii TaxID=438033 RepID=UPI003984254B
MKAYQLKVAIKNSKPPIWRRVVVPAGITFSQFSIILNQTMGWSGYHLFRFEMRSSFAMIQEGDEEFTEFMLWNDEYCLDASKTYIDTLIEQEDWFTYYYDFGDDWRHKITVEAVLPDYEKSAPCVLKYKGNCPIEDSGGLNGYYDYLEIMSDPHHPHHNETREWALEQGYEEYDMDAVNKEFKANFHVVYGEGENRLQEEIYEAMAEGETGLMVTRNPETASRRKPDWDHQEESLADIFECYQTRDILDIARIHGMGEDLPKGRDDLIACTVSHILKPEVMHRFFLCLRDDEIAEYEEAIAAKGPYEAEDPDVFERLQCAGYCGILEGDYVMVPDDAAAAYRTLKDEGALKGRSRRSFLYDCLEAAGYLYGVAELGAIVRIYNQNCGDRISEQDIIDACEQLPEGYKNFVLSGGLYIQMPLYTDATYKKLWEIQDGKEYYIPSRGEISDIVVHGYLPQGEGIRKFAEYLVSEKELPGIDAEFIGARVQWEICSGCSVREIFDFIEEHGVEIESNEELQELADVLMLLWNDTRMIVNRGAKPGELLKGRSRETKNSSGGKIVDFRDWKGDRHDN